MNAYKERGERKRDRQIDCVREGKRERDREATWQTLRERERGRQIKTNGGLDSVNANSIVVDTIGAATYVASGAPFADVPLLALCLPDQLPVLLQEQSVASP